MRWPADGTNAVCWSVPSGCRGEFVTVGAPVCATLEVIRSDVPV